LLVMVLTFLVPLSGSRERKRESET
jgi:hypothetical protein